MVHAANQIIIDRSPEDVYAFLADGLNNPLWRSGVKEISLKSGVAGAFGAVYAQKLAGPGGQPVDGDYEITVAEPYNRLCFQVVAGPARPSGEYRLTPVAAATEVSFSLELQPKGLMKLAGPMIARTMRSEVAQLSALKEVLEQNVPGVGAAG